MAHYKISVDLAGVLDSVHSQINAQVLPTVHQAVRALAGEAAYRWKDAVAKAKLWDGEKQPYIASITWRSTGDFSAVVETDYKLADAIETGRPAYDMKRMLDTSMKVRVAAHGKNAGKRYLIIPMRHNIAGNQALALPMPPHVYAQAKSLPPSTVSANSSRRSGTGTFSLKNKKPVTVPQKSYAWGGRLPAGLAPKLKETHATDPYAGMVRFKTSAGGGHSSAYLTFRVMMEGSPKWIVAARPGLYLAQKVKEQLATEAPMIFSEAIRHLK